MKEDGWVGPQILHLLAMKKYVPALSMAGQARLAGYVFGCFLTCSRTKTSCLGKGHPPMYCPVPIGVRSVAFCIKKDLAAGAGAKGLEKDQHRETDSEGPKQGGRQNREVGH